MTDKKKALIIIFGREHSYGTPYIIFNSVTVQLSVSLLLLLFFAWRPSITMEHRDKKDWLLCSRFSHCLAVGFLRIAHKLALWKSSGFLVTQWNIGPGRFEPFLVYYLLKWTKGPIVLLNWESDSRGSIKIVCEAAQPQWRGDGKALRLLSVLWNCLL